MNNNIIKSFLNECKIEKKLLLIFSTIKFLGLKTGES